MEKKKKLKIALALLVLFIGVGAFVWKMFYSRESRVLTFEAHNPLQENMSQKDLDELFVAYQDCFLPAKRENLRLYFMKYEGLDSSLALKRAERIVQSAAKDAKKDFAAIPNVFVMRDRGQVIGLFNCREENQVTHDSIMVFNVCVRKDKRGQGYGNELMNHSLKVCMKPGKDLTLTVYKQDTKVVDFYKGLDFEIVSNLDEWDHLFPYFNKYLMKYSPKKEVSP